MIELTLKAGLGATVGPMAAGTGKADAHAAGDAHATGDGAAAAAKDAFAGEAENEPEVSIEDAVAADLSPVPAPRAAQAEGRTAPVRVLVVGDGRMGSIVCELVQADPSLELAGVIGIDNRGDLSAMAPAADVAIDFSHPDMLLLIRQYIRRTGAALVSGTTGFGDDEEYMLQEMSQWAPVIHSGNYSLGVAALRHATRLVAETLAQWDVEIVETHHNQKADAPSGTAKMLMAAADPQGTLEAVYGREGFCGKRGAREIGVHAVRGGTVAGVHEVHFFGDSEEVCLTHRAESRRIFAIGAVEAAKRLMGREPGLYTFDELMFSQAK